MGTIKAFPVTLPSPLWDVNPVPDLSCSARHEPPFLSAPVLLIFIFMTEAVAVTLCCEQTAACPADVAPTAHHLL